MRVAVVLLVCLAMAIASDVKPRHQRIVGGSVTNISRYPFATSMLFQRWGLWSQSCGGTIINNRSILSAAHCYFQRAMSSWRIRVGSTNANSGGVVHIIATIIMHPWYDDDTLDNDVAIVRSTTAFVYNNNVRPASIAGANYHLSDNQAVWAIGWGMISGNGPSSEQLREVQVWTINWTTCRNRYREIGWLVTNNMLCTGVLDVGGKDQCGGDSGSPLLHSNVVVGICSWGHPNCGHPRFPGVNVLVSHYSSWISNNA